MFFSPSFSWGAFRARRCAPPATREAAGARKQHRELFDAILSEARAELRSTLLGEEINRSPPSLQAAVIAAAASRETGAQPASPALPGIRPAASARQPRPVGSRG